jgi:hypothetical protein
MKRGWLGLAIVAAVAAAVAIVVLARANLRLTAELAAARTAAARVATAPGETSASPSSAGDAGGEGRSGRRADRNPFALLGTLAGAMNDRPREPSDRDAGPPDVDTRRAERQQKLRDLLGRHPGETDDEYRARVMPMVSTVLSVPRDRVNERRRQFEEAAGLNPDQKTKLDAAFQDASAEVVGLANAAIASGDLTPYQRNSRGVLAFVGSTVGTADALDQRLRTILTPEQLSTMEESGFDPLEYLGVTSPWESVNPPPPPPAPRGPGM